MTDIDTDDLRFLACREAAHIASSLICAADEIDRLRASTNAVEQTVQSWHSTGTDGYYRRRIEKALHKGIATVNHD